MIKVVGMLKKNENLTDEEFRDHYENHHIPLFYGQLNHPGVTRWFRRYLKPITAPVTGETNDSGFDAMFEVWCDRAFYESFFVNPLPEELRAVVAADEAKLFDPDKIHVYLVDEVDTDLSKLD